MSGLYAPVEDIDAAGRRQPDRPSDRADLHGLQRRKPLPPARGRNAKGYSLPAGLLLISAEIRSDDFSQINES